MAVLPFKPASKPTVITLGDGAKVEVRDMVFKPMSEAVCQRCGHLAYFLTVDANGIRRCQPCIAELDAQRALLRRAVPRLP